jgi:hypothetical protein
MDCIANGCGGYRPCKTKQVQLDVTDAILHFIGDGSALSHLNASNVDFGTLSTTVFPASGVTAGTYGSSSNISQVTVDQYGRVTAATNVASVSSQWTGVPGSTIYYIDGVSIGTSADATSNLQVVGNVYVSNALSTTNVYASRYYGDGGLLSNIASQWTGTKGSPIYYVPNVSIGSSDDATSNLQVTGNVYVSNTVTVPNVHVTDTIDVTGALTANAANATFFFDTFTIPYINTQVLNVSSSTTLTGNLVAETANIATLNVGYLTVNSAVVYGATTLNVYGVSNLSTVTANTLSMSGDVFIGNVAITGAVQTTTGPMSRLTFDNTANTSIYPNKIVLYANTASSQYCGFGVTNLGPTGGASIAYGARQNHIFNTGTTLNTEIMRIAVGGTVGIGTATAAAKLHVGTSTLTQNVQVRVDASNVAIATSGGGLVGINTLTPSANLHVLGNTYVSNALTTTNVFAVTANVGTLNVWQVSNLSTLTLTDTLTTNNVYAMNDVVVGPSPFTLQANLHVERGDVFIGNSAVTGTNFTTTGPVNRLIFDNSANTSVVPNKIVLYSNAASGVYGGISIANPDTTLEMGYRSRAAHIFYTGTGATAEVMRIVSSGQVIIGSTSGNAKLYVAGLPSNTNNTHFRVDSSNIAIVTSGGGLVGINTIAPTSNLHVLGNTYVSNAVTTTNVFANTETLTGTTGATTLNVTGNLYASNAVTTTNLYTAGITSSATNTFFNFDTLTIPFVSCTTLNVASTSNLDTVTLTGEPGLTTVFASGNAYVSNALTTTNVFANTSTLTGTTGATTLNVTGNLYVSNAVTTTNVFATTVSTTNPIPFRNRIINGGMTVWQRNVASISTTASLYTTADRWCGALGTSGLILSQWPGPTENLQFPYSLQVTTSTTTTGVPLIEQRIENQNIPDFLNGTPVTVSFWVGQSYGTLMPLTVGLYYATAVNNFGTQTLAVAATKNTPTLTAANAYYSLSFTLTTALAATNGLSLRFTTGGASAIGSTFFLTGVQLEKGAVATPFEVRPYSSELALCQRYYYQLTSPTAAVQGSAQVYAIFGTATGITTQAFWLPLQFPVPMRTPNYTFSNSAVTNFQLLPTGTTTITSVGVQTDSYTSVGATLNFVGTNITAGGSYIFRTNNLSGSTTAFFGFSCEL